MSSRVLFLIFPEFFPDFIFRSAAIIPRQPSATPQAAAYSIRTAGSVGGSAEYPHK